MFKLEKLPKDVREKIFSIEFVNDEEDLMGFVNLNDNWAFEWDGSHVERFKNKTDLIDIVRNCTIREAN